MSFGTRHSKKRTARQGSLGNQPALILPHLYIFYFVYHLVEECHLFELGYTSSASSIIWGQRISGVVGICLCEGGCTHVIRLRARWVSTEAQKEQLGVSVAGMTSVD